MSETTLVMQSPVGLLELASDGASITRLWFVDEPTVEPTDAPDALLIEAQRQLSDYFAGEREEFDLPLAARGTEFQRRVWAELEQIPYGVTVSYGDIARQLDMPPGASRAVGLANGANPIAIVVPCHRVIGSNGTLTGYAGGLERKKFLLDLEAASTQPDLFSSVLS